MNVAHSKLTASHLRRNAYLYIRQSTLRQVFENTESTKRQYALKERSAALGWLPEQVVVIDSDLGQSGASASDRAGFQKLVGDVGTGRAGIVMGLEVSRLARNNTDWHRLLEICALTDTLILDEDGIYDPRQFNDRLLLGLKGTMSEAELHILGARLRGGILSKAQRGDLKQPLPIGFAYGQDGRVVLHPDQQVQQSVRLLFQSFRNLGSACGTVKYFRSQGLEFPRRVQTGPRTGEVVWSPLLHSRVLQIVKNPRYAGAFFFGRTRTRKTLDGKNHVEKLPREQWHTLIRDVHPGYISWEDYEENLRRLQENAQASGRDRRKSPPREGPALLQGLVICGICGNRMTVRYHTRQGRLFPDYWCAREMIQSGATICQTVPGESLDEAIGQLLLEVVSPLALEVALMVQEELVRRAEEVDRFRLQKTERARYEADLAQRRYMQVDPENRLVASTLEAEWNARLRVLNEAQEEYDRVRQSQETILQEQQRDDILSLATDFPRLWKDPLTPDRERKRMVRLMIEDVTLIKEEKICGQVRFRGGATRTLELPLPLSAPELRKTSPLAVEAVNGLLDDFTDREIAAILNERGVRSGTGQLFNSEGVKHIRKRYRLADRFTRLRRGGMMTKKEVAAALRVSPRTVLVWKQSGLLQASVYNDKGDCLFDPPGDHAPKKHARKGLRPRKKRNVPSEHTGGAV